MATYPPSSLLAIPEYEVALAGGRRPSQNDLFVLGRIDRELAVITVEGKVDESFGPELSKWLVDASPGKRLRIAALQETLGIMDALPGDVRYQLLHRTASPVLEAARLGAPHAAMIVHSFSPSDAWLDDYRRFAELLGARGAKGRLERIPGRADPELWIGWVGGDTTGARESRPKVPSIRVGDRPLPRLIVHADWGSAPAKRWMCAATLVDDGRYEVHAPEPVGDAPTLLRRLRTRADGASVLVGFDFPIGLPAAYAELAGIQRFPDLLAELGQGRWARFWDVAETAEEISLTRPFYPMRPGGTKQKHLTDGLGVESMRPLLRLCERGTETRGPASPLFWTMGGKQVGKAAILGWREILAPALADPELDVGLWPFDGAIASLTDRHDITVAETYPAEACLHLGMTPPGRHWSKTSQEGRTKQRAPLLAWAAGRPVTLSEELTGRIDSGFGPSKDAEDPFDALLGLLSMIEVVLGHRPEGAPEDVAVREMEGWILGQDAGGGLSD